MVVVKALLCRGFHVACSDTCAVVKALGFCGKGMHVVTPGTAAVVWCHRCSHHSQQNLVQSGVYVVWYLGKDYCCTSPVCMWRHLGQWWWCASVTGLQLSSAVNRLWAGSARVLWGGGIKGWQEERFKSGLGEGRVSPPQ